MTSESGIVEQQTVFVVSHDGGYEGHSEPLAVFKTRTLADIFVAGAETGYRHGMKVFEMPVQDGIALQDEDDGKPVPFRDWYLAWQKAQGVDMEYGTWSTLPWYAEDASGTLQRFMEGVADYLDQLSAGRKEMNDG